MAIIALQARTVQEYNPSSQDNPDRYANPYDPSNPSTAEFASWVEETQTASRDWRASSWRDCEFFDGKQWSDVDYDKAIDAGIEPLTINQIFPTISLVLGSQALNKLDIVAKGRTHKDSELSQIMTEGIKYVMDQHDGEFKISEAFKDQAIPGIGFLYCGYDMDPRKETIKIAYRDWKEMGWDPYASPWLETDDCRYVYHSKWIDTSHLKQMFPDKAKDIDNMTEDGGMFRLHGSAYEDEANEVEWQKRYGAMGGWVDPNRKRCRPVEMWYTQYQPAVFLRFPDGTVQELKENVPAHIQYQQVSAALEIIKATVKKMRVCIFLGSIILYEGPTPYSHDDFPFIPFVGYIDRYKQPYGIPRQVRDMQIETNKRRSMALRLLNSRRVIAEADVVAEDKMQSLYEEANKPDGFLVVNSGAIGQKKIQIIEQADMAPAQMNMMTQSEMEIQRISGINADTVSQQGNRAPEAERRIDERTNTGVAITAPLFDNLRRSMKRLGEQITCAIQNKWTGQKILRITDRVSGAERFVEINKMYQMQDGTYTLKNDITQGRYDAVISNAPIADTARDQYMQMLIEWAKKSTPELIAPLMAAALELSNLPNKEALLARIKPLLGINPEEEDLSADELRQSNIQKAKAQAQMQEFIQQLEIERQKLDMGKTAAETEKLKAETYRIANNAELDSSRAQLEGFKTGADIEHQNRRLELDASKVDMDNAHKTIDRETSYEKDTLNREQSDLHKATELRQADDHKLLDTQKELTLADKEAQLEERRIQEDAKIKAIQVKEQAKMKTAQMKMNQQAKKADAKSKAKSATKK